MFNWIIGWLVDLSWRKILVPLLFVCFVKSGTTTTLFIFSILAESLQMETSRHDAIKRDTYFTVAVLLCSNWETACIKPNAILRRERNDHNSPRTTRISLSDTFTSADLFLGDGGRIEIVSESRNNLLPLTALLLKDQSDCEIPAAKIWPPTQTPVRDCIRPFFTERPM